MFWYRTRSQALTYDQLGFEPSESQETVSEPSGLSRSPTRSSVVV